MRKLLLVPLMLALVGSCPGQMTTNYDTYNTYSVDSNLVIYQTVVVEGYTSTPSGNCNTTCCQSTPYPPYYNCWSCPIPGCVGSTHTPSIYNILGGVGGWTTGPPADPFAYQSFQTTIQLQAVHGQNYGGSTEAQISCSVAGTIFDVGGPILAWFTEAFWGPPVSIAPDGTCYWGSLACKAGTTATCTVGKGIPILNPIGCPNYVQATWLVVNGGCVVPVLTAAGGPGDCN
jgi:hypothetical protein